MKRSILKSWSLCKWVFTCWNKDISIWSWRFNELMQSSQCECESINKGTKLSSFSLVVTKQLPWHSLFYPRTPLLVSCLISFPLRSWWVFVILFCLGVTGTTSIHTYIHHQLSWEDCSMLLNPGGHRLKGKNCFSPSSEWHEHTSYFEYSLQF